ncbi:heparan-alpha-glucosaminide N-acetyltransferase [Aquincola sp. MAHUQ-54]|uniref:Heparan-alpha-glucosaminide N-acetyltransferase n=1 Tax=Aquincola agrisoli TaxID=3119538 RepID=A0AAW9QBE7_9BURK
MAALPAQAGRADRLDALRGAAMVWMAAFHFCFDLNFLRFIPPQDFYNDPRWTLQRLCIVSLFLACAGVSQALALRQGQRWGRFWRRWLQLAGCALLVSVGSWFMFPASFISFGVLHGLAVMLVVTRLTARAGAWLWPAGLAAVLLPQWVQHPFFDSRWTDWIGLVTHKPAVEDYVPLLPWLGVVWWGLAAGQWLAASRPAWLMGRLPRPLRGLAALGRWPLTFYMLHQPVLIGLLLLADALRR